MPADRVRPPAPRASERNATSRSIWLTATWTGTGAAVVCAVVAIAGVAVCWLPASNGAGSAGSAIRAGVLTFLAGLHGGITVDGLPTAFVPLGITVLIGAVCWRAGAALGATANDAADRQPRELLRIAAVQAAAFAVSCGLAAGFADLGTSSVSVAAAAGAGLVLFTVTGGAAFVRASGLAATIFDRMPGWGRVGLRAATAGLAAYIGAGALLVAGSLVLHHHQVQTLSSSVGGGWSGVPVLVLGILAAPNAAVAGASYLAGPGFALGSGSAVSLGSAVHGTLPAFPVLGAVPAGPATTPVWLLTAATPMVAGACLARVARTMAGWRDQLRVVAAAALAAGCAGLVLGWQGGGAIGSGRLSSLGASPWQLGLAVGTALGGVGAVAVGAFALLEWWRNRSAEEPSLAGAALRVVALPIKLVRSGSGDAVEASDTDGDGKLAG